MASFTGRIPAGGEGHIEVQVKTQGYAGRTLVQVIPVQTNAPEQGEVRLEIRGFVNAFARMVPPTLSLQGQAGAAISQSLTLTPDPAFPFSIQAIRADKGENFRFSFSAAEDGASYRIFAENTRREPGRYLDTLVVETDSPVRKHIRIHVLGDIRAEGDNQP